MAETPWIILGNAIRFVAVLVLIYLVLPTFVIVPLSFSSESFLSFPPPGWSLRWYEQLIAHQDYGIALANSLKIGLLPPHWPPFSAPWLRWDWPAATCPVVRS